MHYNHSRVWTIVINVFVSPAFNYSALSKQENIIRCIYYFVSPLKILHCVKNVLRSHQFISKRL